MDIHSQTYQFLIVVVDRVEVLQKQIAEKEVTVVVLVQWVLSDSELANRLSLMEVSCWA